MDVIEPNGPDMNPPRLKTGTLVEDLGCPHCGRLCDVCVDQDAALHQLQGAVHDIERLTGWLRAIVNVREDHAAEYAQAALDGFVYTGHGGQ